MAYFKVFLLFLSPYPLSPSYPLFLPLCFYSLFPLRLPWQLSGKESTCNAVDMGLIPGSRRSPRRGNENPLQYFFPGKSHGQRSLVGYSPLNHKESDVTEHSPEIIIGTRGKLWKKKNLIHTFHSLWSTVGKWLEGCEKTSNKENNSENNILDCNNSSGEKLSK